jgi:broad specificity phosphatase PhoE
MTIEIALYKRVRVVLYKDAPRIVEWNIMSGRLTLICHGSTSAIHAASFPLDKPLDAQGEAQAASLAGTFGRVDVAWSSPALRTRQTAERLQLAATIEPSLRDIDLGWWAGSSLADIAAARPETVEAWRIDPTAAPHGGETINDLFERVSIWLESHSDDKRRSVAVTHSSIIRAAIIIAIDASPRSFWRIDIGPLCRADLRRHTGAWQFRAINVTTR